MHSIYDSLTVTALCITCIILFDQSPQITRTPKLIGALTVFMLGFYSFCENCQAQQSFQVYTKIAAITTSISFFPVLNLYIAEYTQNHKLKKRRWLVGSYCILGTLLNMYIIPHCKVSTINYIYNLYLFGVGTYCIHDGRNMLMTFRKEVLTFDKASPLNLHTFPTQKSHLVSRKEMHLYLVINYVLVLFFTLPYLSNKYPDFVTIVIHLLSVYVLVKFGYSTIIYNKHHHTFEPFFNARSCVSTDYHTAIINNDLSDRKETSDTAGDARLQEIFLQIDEQLPSLIVQNQLFLDPTLSINDISDKLNVSRSYVSKYFNQKLELSFVTYINQLRIEHAIMLMKKQIQHHTIDFIAQESGFTNRTTFYRAFKRVKKMSPTEFYLKLKTEKPEVID